MEARLCLILRIHTRWAKAPRVLKMTPLLKIRALLSITGPSITGPSITGPMFLERLNVPGIVMRLLRLLCLKDAPLVL